MPDPALILEGDFLPQSGYNGAQRLFDMPLETRPTAIFAANDETAFGVLRGLNRQGWRVPANFSVCGFGDIPMAELMVPPLTTVHIPLRELGRSGATYLLALLNHESVPSLEVLPTTIVERETMAPII